MPSVQYIGHLRTKGPVREQRKNKEGMKNKRKKIRLERVKIVGTEVLDRKCPQDGRKLNDFINNKESMATSDCPGGNRNFNINNNAQQIVQSIAICKHY